MKYDCTKAKDFLHEAARAFECCKAMGHRGCISHCPLEIRDKTDGRLSCIKRADISDIKWLNISDSDFDEIVSNLQKWSDSHPERRELTEDEIIILKAFKALGYKYITVNQNGTVCCYTVPPKKDETEWYTNTDYEQAMGATICKTNKFFSGILYFNDKEPAKIEELLEGVEE